MFNFLLSFLFITNRSTNIKSHLYCELNRNITNSRNITKSNNMDSAMIPLDDLPRNDLIWKNINQNHPLK